MIERESGERDRLSKNGNRFVEIIARYFISDEQTGKLVDR